MSIDESLQNSEQLVVINPPMNLNNFGSNILQICYPDKFSEFFEEYYEKEFPVEVASKFMFIEENDVKLAINCARRLSEVKVVEFQRLFKLALSELRTNELWDKTVLEQKLFSLLKETLLTIESFKSNLSKLNLILHVFCGTDSSLV